MAPLPDQVYVTAVEAITFLGDGECRALEWFRRTTAVGAGIAGSGAEAAVREAREKLSAARRAADEGEAILLAAARAGDVSIYGKPSDPNLRQLIAAAPSEPVPDWFLREPVAVNLLHNRLECDARASMEAHASLFGRWFGELLVKVVDVKRLAARARQTQDGRRKTIAAQSDCRRWLAEMMTGGQPRAPKREIKREAQERFGVSGRSFDRAWNQAVAEGPHAVWSKPGRKSSR